MNRDFIDRSMRHFGQMFIDGNVNGLARHSTLPLPIYVPGQRLILQSRDEIEFLLERYLQTARCLGVVRVAHCIEVIEDMTDKRAMFCATWTHFDAHDNEMASSWARYVLTHNDDHADAMIELVEYLEMSFPNVLEAEAVVTLH